MRVLHICTNYTDTALYQKLAESLSQIGVEQEIIVPNRYDNVCKFELNDNVKVIKCYSKFDRFFYFRKQRKIYRNIINEFCPNDVKVVHAHLLFTNGYVAYKLNKKYGTKYIVAIRNTDVNAFFKYMIHLRKLGIRIMKNSERIIFISPSYYDQMIGKYIPHYFLDDFQNKSVVIPNGIDAFWHKNKCFRGNTFSFDPHNIRLIYAGRIDRNKNIIKTQLAMRELRNQGINCSLTVVGKIEDDSVYQKISQDPFTHIYDAVPKEQLIEFYRSSDIFVMPSIHETFGLVYVEAMSQGLPIIYTKTQGFDGFFEDGTVGYSVDCYSEQDIAEKIKLITEDYYRFSNTAVNSIDKFKWETIASKYRNIYMNTEEIDEEKDINS